jgi:hypothetical protein
MGTEIRFGGWRFLTTSDIQQPVEGLAFARGLRNGDAGLARDCRRVLEDRKRLKTSRRLGPLFGVAPRFRRIDTLECRETSAQSAFGYGGRRRSKHMRGGRKPND